jgi:hypothetical protein
MIEGSGAGSVLVTNGSGYGSGRQKTYRSYGSGSTILVITSLIFQVDWTKEVECFRTFMAETARFHRVATSEGASFSLTQHAEEKTDDEDEWKYTIGTSAVCVVPYSTRRRFPTESDVPKAVLVG